MADKVQFDGKTYLPIAEAASVTGVTEQQVRLLAGQGRVLLRAIGKKIYADFDGLQAALREAPNPSVGAPAVPAPIVQAPPGVKIVVPTPPPIAPIASSKPQVSGADAAAIREKFAAIDTNTVSLSKVSVMPRSAGAIGAPAARPAVTPAMPVSSAPEKTLAPIPPVATAPVSIKTAPAPIAAPSPKPSSLEAELLPEVQKIAPTANRPSATPAAPIVPMMTQAPQNEQKIPDTPLPATPVAPVVPAVVQAKAPAVQEAIPEPTRSSAAMHSAATHMSSAELSAMGSITQSDVPVPSPLQGVKVPSQPPQSNIARSLSTTAAALAAFVFVIGTGIAAYEKSPQAVTFLASAGKQVAAVFNADPTVTYTSSGAPSGSIVADGSPSANQALATAATIPSGASTSTQPIYYVYNYPVIERVVQEVKYINADTPADWNAQLDALYQRIQAQIQSLNISTNTNFSQQYQVIAQTNNIDKLGSVTIDNNSIFSGGTITGSTLTDIASLDVDGDTNLAGLTVGDITASGNGAFSGSGTFSYIVASSTNATSTFNGALLAARSPTVAHTFGTWNTGAADSAWWDAALVVNPASATGDSNLISAAVGGSVKFLVDAEGDVFVNNLTSVGSVTLSTTSASSFNVEGNTVLGDSISDTTTINGTLIVTGTTTASTVSGKFGVGTTTPWGRLSVLAADNASDPQFVVASSSAIGLIFNKSGYFGIGTSSPTNKLEVSGNTFLGGNLTVTGSTNFSGGATFSGLSSFNLASTSQLSVFQKAYFGASATSTFDSAGNLSLAGTLDVSGNTTLANATSTAFYSGTASSTNLFSTSLAAGTATFGRATTTNLFSTTASSTNLFSSTAQFGTLSVLGALTQTGLGTFQNGFVSQASSTVAGAFTTTGTNTFGGALNIAGAITSTATSANTFPYASTTALSVSGTAYFPGSGIWNSSGNLGVGTTSPQTLAHIWKSGGDTSALLRIEEYGATGDSAIQFRVDNSSSWFTGIDNSDSNSFKIGTGALGSADKFTITTTGNVGIGTTSPFRLLSVAGASQFDSTAWFGSSGSAFGVDQGGSIELKGTNSSAQPYFDIGQTAYDYDFRYQFTPSSNVLSISASSTANILNVVGGGKVGVGTTTPNGLLSLVGAASAYGTLSIYGTSGSLTSTNLFAAFGDNADATTAAKFVIQRGGNVGIGTTSPYRKLSVTDTVAAAQASIAYDSTRDTQLQTDSSGDFILNPSGDDVRINDDNLWVCAGGSCPSGTPSGNGNLIVEGNVGIGTSAPNVNTKLQINTTDGGQGLYIQGGTGAVNESAYLTLQSRASFGYDGTRGAVAINDDGVGGTTATKHIVFDTAGSERLRITSGGSVGIGTTSPAQQLGVAGMLFVGANGATGMGTATSTFYGDIKIIGKLDVSTIDPVYTIDGEKWATYGHSTVGIKEETVLKVVPEVWDSSKRMYAYTIDFDKVAKGSDLWLFYQVTDFGKDWNGLVTTLAPAFDGRTYYEENTATNSLTIYASESAPVSVRLIANRYDFTKWGNFRPDQDGDTAGTHVIESKPLSEDTN